MDLFSLPVPCKLNQKEGTKESVSGPMSTLTLHGNGGPVSIHRLISTCGTS